MRRMRVYLGFGLLTTFAIFTAPTLADTYKVIVKGKVTMEDGSAPPFTVGIERICSDNSGSAPGPITNKKGEWIWNMEIDPFASRSCLLRATHAGYTSSTLDASNINLTSRNTTVDLPPLVIFASVPDPSSINASENNIPSKAKSPFLAAMKALDDGNFTEAGSKLEAAVAASPKFAQGWHALGIVDGRLHKPAEARQAYEHAIESDPKMFPAYVMLARLCVSTKDWPCVSKTADALTKADPKRPYPEISLHRAVALYELKDLAGAETSAQEAIRLDPQHKRPREEYVLGRILEAKGDVSGAREHISKYLELDPNAADKDLVQAHLQDIGKSTATGVDPDLEPL